jgi:uncharacterized protein
MINALMLVVCLTWVALIAIPHPSVAEQSFDIKANYTKSEQMVSMRDGVKLFTAVYAPKDASQKYPILLNRTPYSCAPYGADAYKENIGPSALFAKEGYIVVYQDVRGAWMSEETYANMRPQNDHKSKPSDVDESSDTYDTIDWLVKNIPNNKCSRGDALSMRMASSHSRQRLTPTHSMSTYAIRLSPFRLSTNDS